MRKNKIKYLATMDLYVAIYNQLGSAEKGYHVLTFLNTFTLRNRHELSNRTGKYTSSAEAVEIEGVLKRLLSVSALNELSKQILVTAPYRPQGDFLTETLNTGILQERHPRDKLGVQVETIGSVIGLERDIGTTPMTRSNSVKGVGFLIDPRRINMATSRAKKLLVIVGDSSTLCDRLLMVRGIWKACLERRQSGGLKLTEPIRGKKEIERTKELKQMMVVIRYSNGYDLRDRG